MASHLLFSKKEKKVLRSAPYRVNALRNHKLTHSVSNAEEKISTKDLTCYEAVIQPDDYINANVDKTLEKILLQDLPMTPLHRSCFMSTIRSFPTGMVFPEVKLQNCNVNEQLLTSLSSEMRSRNLKTVNLDLSDNADLEGGALRSLIEAANPVTLNLNDSAIKVKKNQQLYQIENVEEIFLNNTMFVGCGFGTVLSSFCSQNLRQLSLIDSPITSDDLRIFAKGLPNKISLKFLDLSHVTLDKIGMTAVGEIVNKTGGMDSMILANCGLTYTCLKAFYDKVKQKVNEVDFSCNDQIDEKGEDIIAKIAEKVQCKRLVSCSREIAPENIVALMNGSSDTTVRDVDFSENLGISATEVGKLANKWKLEELDLSECRMSLEDLKDLKKSLGKHVLEVLYIQEVNERRTDEKLKAIQDLKRCATEVVY